MVLQEISLTEFIAKLPELAKQFEAHHIANNKKVAGDKKLEVIFPMSMVLEDWADEFQNFLVEHVEA